MTFPMKFVDKTETLTYMRNVKVLPSTMIPLKRPTITETNTCVPMNPCVLQNKDGRTYLVVVRCVNYDMCACGKFSVRQASTVGHIETRNVLYVMDEERIYLEKEIIDKTTDPFPFRDVNNPCLIDGYEDMRIFWKGDTLHYIAVHTCYHPVLIPNIVMGTLDAEYNIVTRTHVYLDPMRCEKNWIPFVLGDSVYIMYNTFPLVMFELVSYPERDMALVVEKDMTRPDVRVRGGGGPVKYNDYYFIIVHEAVLVNTKRTYVHRFVRYDSSFLKDGDISDPFVFFHQGVEFSCGLCLSHDGKDFVVSVGVEDADAALVRVPVSYVLNTFFS